MYKSNSDTALYNITRYLQKCYEEKKEPDPILMELVNFSEGGYLNYQFGTKNHGQINVEVKETLAQNCMNFLPFEAYEKYFTAKWIEYVQDNGQNIMLAAIYKRDIKLMEKIYNVGLEKALTDKDYAHSFMRDVITPIMSVSENARTNHNEDQEVKIEPDFGTRYLSLVKKTTADMKYLKNRMWYPNKTNELKYTKNPNWIKDVEYGYHRGSTENQLYDLLSSLVWNKNFTPFFVDAFTILLKEHKDLNKVKSVLGIEPQYNEGKNILGDAFMSKNKDVAEFLINSLKLTEEECLLAYDNKALAYFSFLKTSSQGLDTTIEQCFNKNYNNLKTLFFPNSDTKFLPFLMLGNDDELKEYLLKNKDILNIPLIENEKNLKFATYLAKTIQHYSATTEGRLEWKRNPSNKKSIHFFVAEYLIKTNSPLLNEVDLKNASVEDLASLEKDMLELHKFADLYIGRQIHPINNEKVSQWIKVFALDQSLTNNSQYRTKVKI